MTGVVDSATGFLESLSWLDIGIVVAVLLHALAAYRRGFWVTLGAFVGFVVGGGLALRFLPELLGGIDQLRLRAAVTIIGILVIAFIGDWIGALIGVRIRRGIVRERFTAVLDAVLGAALALVMTVTFAWLIAGSLRDGPFPALEGQIADSRIIAAADEVLPRDADVLADQLRQTLAQSELPRVFGDLTENDIQAVAPPAEGKTADITRAARDSIVKVSAGGPGCRYGSTGSGVVIADDRVMTNAHVVAGDETPTVRIGGTGKRIDATVVSFDPDEDLAVLKVDGLNTRVARLGADARRGDDVTSVGFPGGGRYTGIPGRVRQILRASGADIYGKSGTVREVYALRTSLHPGNSGGPVLDAKGRVVGLVFGVSENDSETGYAMTADEIGPLARSAPKLSRTVDAGPCRTE